MDRIVKFSEVVKSCEKVNESHIDDEVYDKIVNTKEYVDLKSKISNLVNEFRIFLEEEEIVDEGDNDHDMALNLALSELVNDDVY